MKEPTWITVDVIYAVHEMLLDRFGGLSGIRDEGLLHSALSRPQHSFAYESPTVFEMATEYTLGIVKNHPFLDGNKRTGFMAAYVFLGTNGIDFTASEEEVVINTLALAAGEIDRNQYSEWLEVSC